MYRSVASSVAVTTWRFQTFSNSVSGISQSTSEFLAGRLARSGSTLQIVAAATPPGKVSRVSERALAV